MTQDPKVKFDYIEEFFTKAKLQAMSPSTRGIKIFVATTEIRDGKNGISVKEYAAGDPFGILAINEFAARGNDPADELQEIGYVN